MRFPLLLLVPILTLGASVADAQTTHDEAGRTKKSAEGFSLPSLLSQHRSAVARVWCRGEGGSGFLFRDRQHLLTVSQLVESGQAVMVEFSDGTKIDGTAVVVDDQNGLALVELERPGPGSPLSIDSETPAVGDPVAVVAPILQSGWDREVPRHDWVVTKGRVAGSSDALLKIDVSLPAGAVGAPVLSHDGAVVGMVALNGGVFLLGGNVEIATASEPIRAMQTPRGDEAPYHGRLQLERHFGYQMHIMPEAEIVSHGVDIGLRLVGWDRFTLTQRLGVGFSGMVPTDDNHVIERRHFSGNVDLELGYRLLLTPPDMDPVHLTLGAGASYQFHNWRQTTAHLENNEVVLVRDDFEDSYLRPTLGAGMLLLGLVEMGYLFELDPNEPSQSSHRMTAGFTF